ncbi:MAG: DNA polymerase III, subunit gamma and tau [Candidatus Spechtbacteria bacterium RIFCSPLOWO2_12_FULL_38_22]|uniref:DNA polymerase III subunit gamma/tau n=1 Tax=Candidatus Spechtbacteria bacterium RIFCSPLOWO2_12_FULL_38_22 TaxID=1802165 RepID=A0A1G2HIK0_9BACT|nr:MAG: DNA polymerase III, subunit gamma and tau [Candidatus Spechtbacteria bacterium RIFCSPLOWO2_01_FULL_38_20]OGZ62336.1 MAG: DNA polymerase III, subunit gamma and tau [Candidatus Spechtbacteria bacterium RIFCSPLOWO2_12_FULL_38_22]
MAVLYRKYRPKSFEDIVGQEHIVTTLRNAIKMGEVAHAYLFSGPRGTGKTTMARVLTKTLNCQDSKEKDGVCLSCSVCAGIDNGSFIDLIEIDAASNRGIDDVRALKESVQFAPNQGIFKVYLIDEAHMLTKEASNALLKMLEEPPVHVIFVLATTEPHKLLPTIISRTQRFDFRFLTLEEILGRLKNLTNKEKRKIDDGVLNLVAGASGGSLRDAESILGKIFSLNNIEESEIRKLLGATDLASISNFIDFIIENNKEAVLKYINDMVSGGEDLEQFINSSIDYVRKLLFLKLSPSSEVLISGNLTKEELKKAKIQTTGLTEKKIYGIIKQLLEAVNNIKYSPMPQLPLELAVIEIIGE